MGLSLRIAYEALLQSLISLEASVSTPGSGSYLRLVCLRVMGVTVDSPVWVGQDTWILNPRNLTLGCKVCIGESSKIVCPAPVSIGDNFLSASGLYINSGSHDIETLRSNSSSISIGKRVWCGMRVTICSGVCIGDDVVIGAGSLVTKSIPSGYIAYGVPAKPIRKIERNHPENIIIAFNHPSLWKIAKSKILQKKS
ncbi:acyltransferase [Nostoc sp. CCCryo 231-06]|nr:acyltransferase [Nostoc sp. CCCryo 231-06]